MPLNGRSLVPLGLAVLAATWAGPLPRAAHGSFAAHMAIHMSVVAVAAPLVADGLAPRSGPLLRALPPLALPAFASLLDLVAVWIWHTPRLHFAARTETAAFAVEQATFLAVALLLWLAAFGSALHGPRGGALAGAAALLFTSMHMTLLGVLIALSRTPICTVDASGLEAILADQEASGLLILGIGGAVYLLGGLSLARRELAASPGPIR
jgi:putative membrane protein